MTAGGYFGRALAVDASSGSAATLPLTDDVLREAMICYGQNGEALRPEQGYPLRLLLPGFEGNINVKWLRRLKVGTAPFMTRWETSKYTDLLPDGTAYQFSLVMEAKSVITSPSGRQQISRGFREIQGLAWSGRGRITDETRYRQPTRDSLIKVRGLHSSYHYNGIQSWKIAADGSVRNVYA